MRVDIATGRIEGTVANPNDKDDSMELRQEAGAMRIVARTKIAPGGTFTFESAPAGISNLLRNGRSTAPVAVDVAAAQTAKAEIP